MYNGLFGDLPSAKKDSGASKDDETSKAESMEKPEKDSEAASSSTNNVVPQGNSVKDTVKPMFVPRFMPQQMKRPRNNHVAAAKPQWKQESKKKVTTKASTKAISPPQVKHEQPTPNDDFTSPNDRSGSIMVSAPPGKRDDFIADQGERFVAPPSSFENEPVENKLFEGKESFEQPSGAIVEREPEYLSQLHEQAKNDLYDPLLPNDLLHYWEHQRATKEKERLMHERDLALREHERMRQELDAERQRLQAEGDLDRLVQHRMEHQQGRKVSNVPAWLLEQQRMQREAASSGGATTD